MQEWKCGCGWEGRERDLESYNERGSRYEPDESWYICPRCGSEDRLEECDGEEEDE